MVWRKTLRDNNHSQVGLTVAEHAEVLHHQLPASVQSRLHYGLILVDQGKFELQDDFCLLDRIFGCHKTLDNSWRL